MTVEQFQAVHTLQSKQMDDYDRLTEIISVLYDETPSQIDDLPVSEYNNRARAIQHLLTEEIPGEAKMHIRIGKRKYSLHCPVDKIKHRQFCEIQHFSSDIIGNLHNILASICMPVRWFVARPNKAEDHSKYAEDFKQAKLIDVYHACVFFCKVYAASLRSTADYLLKTLPEDQAWQVYQQLNDSADVTDGFTIQRNWQNSKT